MELTLPFLAFALVAALFGLASGQPGSALMTGVMAALLVWLIVRTQSLSRQLTDLRREMRALATDRPAENKKTAEDRVGPAPVREPAPADPGFDELPPIPPGPERPNWLVRYFTEGNLIVRIGILILLFGIGFLISYAVERSQVPVGVRLWGIALLGVALIASGWRLRRGRRPYGLALQGGGLGTIYLVTYSALRLYEAISPGPALALMIGLVILGCALSLRQNTQLLAGLSLTGGFLAPLLTSTGDGSHLVLFSYYLLLNSGITIMAWHRPWRRLNLLGFGFTLCIGILWGHSSYDVEDYLSTQLFVVAFFLLFVGISVLFSLRQPPRLRELVDGTLVFGTATAVFLIQAWLLGDNDAHLAWSTALLSLFYAGLGLSIRRLWPMQLGVLALAFLVLSATFATLTVPAALEERWTSAVWVLEATGLLWLGLRQNQLSAVGVAMILYVAAGVAILDKLDSVGRPYGGTAMALDAVGIVLMTLGTAAGTRLLMVVRPMHSAHWRYEGALVLGLSTVFWLSILLLRFVYFATDMNWSVSGIGNSVTAQATLSIAWTLFGLAAALYASRTGFRPIWMAGASLIAFVVVKLFVLDLSGAETLGRVVSFLTVGGLLLLVGYFAPIPERHSEDSPASTGHED